MSTLIEQFFDDIRTVGIDAPTLRKIVQGDEDTIAELADGKQIESLRRQVKGWQERFDSVFGGAESQREAFDAALETALSNVTVAQQAVSEARDLRSKFIYFDGLTEYGVRLIVGEAALISVSDTPYPSATIDIPE